MMISIVALDKKNCIYNKDITTVMPLNLKGFKRQLQDSYNSPVEKKKMSNHSTRGRKKEITIMSMNNQSRSMGIKIISSRIENVRF